MFKCYRQIESADCGIACIRMIAKYFGKAIPNKYLQSITDINRLGMSLNDITDCCKKIGIKAVCLRLRPKDIKLMPLPAVLYWEQSHFVVLYDVNAGKNIFKVADPALGKIKYTQQELEQYWLPEGSEYGLVIVAEPTEQFYEKDYQKEHTTNDFFRYVSSHIFQHKKHFLFALVISVIIMLADLIAPYLIKHTIDDGISLKNTNLIVLFILGQLAVMMGSLVASGGLNILMTKIGLGIHLNMIKKYLVKLAYFPLSFFDKKASTDFVQKLQDHSRIKNFLMEVPNSMIILGLTICVFSVLLFYYNKLIFCIFLFISIVEFIWSILFLSKKKSLDYAFFTNSSKNQNYAYELTNGMADLKVNNAEHHTISKWTDIQENLNRISMKSAWLQLIQGNGQQVISKSKELVITGICAFLVVSENITFGTMLTISYIVGRLSSPFNSLNSSVNNFQNAILSYQRLDDVIKTEPDTAEKPLYKNSKIELDNVWFRYAGSSSPYIIKNLSLKITPGKVHALVGSSGCGKSSLIKIMLGFYLPQKGTLKLSDYDIEEIDRNNWLGHCGVVMQDGKIFSGSILENVSLSDKHPDIKKAIEVIDVVGLKSYIDKLPLGIYTKIGVYGVEMSGGQKQRLLIARALYKDPDILFLDEATSSLDANNERKILENIHTRFNSKTIIVAAHRLSTVQNADMIIYMEEGEIKETGNHADLINKKGKYWQLVHSQINLKE